MDMLEVVPRALGEDLRKRIVFVGGSTTGLLVTDNFTREEIRFTEDIDLVVKVAAYAECQNSSRHYATEVSAIRWRTT